MKIKKALLVILLAGLGAGVASGIWWKIYSDNMSEANSTIQTLNTTINSIGVCTQVYTLSQKVHTGEEIKEEDLILTSMPESMVTECWVTDMSSVLGKYYKVDVEIGTPLTMDLIVDNQIDDTTRQFNLAFDRWPVGLHVGDYVDVRLALPQGEDYIVLSKVHVKDILTNTITTYLTEEQWDIYSSALIDYYVHIEQGASIYLAKYVEPGAQSAAVPFYAVRPNIRAMMELNPNIVDLASTACNENLRNSIDKVLSDTRRATFGDMEDPGTVYDIEHMGSGHQSFNDVVNSDYLEKKSQEEQLAEQSQYEQETSDTSDQTVMEDLEDELVGGEEGGLQ